ncbi:MAG: hypothetical protein Q8O33_14150 [Pseudomonadota bacterium]|nr:hypothetical protein [Pseudomonadota bacterium]
MENDALLSWIEADIASCRCGVPEFPVTTMTRTLWSGIKAIAKLLDRPKAALDAGSGSGAHSFLLASLGVENVQGLERCGEAVACAKDRANRLHAALPDAANWAWPQFIQGCVEAVPRNSELLDQFDIMTMNPPAFYTPTKIDISRPLDSGLYTGNPPTPAEPDPANPINDFFRIAVSQRLAPGGIAICTWPGIQARQVTDGTASKLHPAQILMRRFNWQIEGADSVLAEDFYRFSSKLAYNDSPGNGFRRYTHLCLEDGKYHSYVQRSDPEHQHQPTFAFGVLAIRRDTHVPDLFHLIDINLQT